MGFGLSGYVFIGVKVLRDGDFHSKKYLSIYIYFPLNSFCSASKSSIKYWDQKIVLMMCTLQIYGLFISPCISTS